MSGCQESLMCEGAPAVKVIISTEKRSWPKPNKVDLIGRRFGALVVTEFFGEYMGLWAWKCRCDCGNNGIFQRARLINGDAKSCGCMKWKTSKFPEYKAFDGMKDRCRNEKSKDYASYGGRGISVCERWLESFNNFYTDMGDRPSENHSIERKDNNGNYEPDNCKWATKSEQQRNLRVRKNSSSGVKGVRLISWTNKFMRRYKYEVRFYIDGKNKGIGTFDTLEDAAKARKEAEIKYWGK